MPEYIDKTQLLQVESLLKTEIIQNNKVALWLYEQMMHDIEAQPVADVAPVVHGKWEYDKDATDWGIGGYVCSECKNKNNNLPYTRVKWVKMFSGSRYCPNCGAKMDETK